MVRHRLIFFGSSAQSARLLADMLTQDWCEIVGVVTRPAPQQGHRHQVDTPVVAVAQQAHIPVWRPANPDEVIPEIAARNVEAGLLFAYGKLLSDNLLAAFPKGIINVHPSLLPRHRGPSPIEATILAGDSEAGTTIMLITHDMDSGPIIQQTRFPIKPFISKVELWEKLYAASLTALENAAPRYLAGELTPSAQAGIGATYCKLIRKDDGVVDLSSETAESLERKIRAYADWPRVRIPVLLNHRPTELILLDADLRKGSGGAAALQRAHHSLRLRLPDGYLKLGRAQFPGRKPISSSDLANLQYLELA